MPGQRKDYISWDEYFMGVAQLSGMRSKDPNTQVGACIVGNDNRIYPWDITDFPTAARTICFRGQEREGKWRRSTLL